MGNCCSPPAPQTSGGEHAGGGGAAATAATFRRSNDAAAGTDHEALEHGSRAGGRDGSVEARIALVDSGIVGNGGGEEDLALHLAGWLADQTVGEPQCELLFRASRDGWDAKAFHRHCDDQGATLTVILEQEHGYVFGGYADAPWNSSGFMIGSGGGAFLFALRCHAGLGPTRMGLAGTKNGRAMHGIAAKGPSFGHGELDLGATLGRDAGDGSRTDVGGNSVHECPAGQDGRSLLTGARRFRAAEVEVYRVRGDALSKPLSNNALMHGI